MDKNSTSSGDELIDIVLILGVNNVILLIFCKCIMMMKGGPVTKPAYLMPAALEFDSCGGSLVPLPEVLGA